MSNRNRNVRLDNGAFDMVDKGAKREAEIYTMTLKKMTKGTIKRYRQLRDDNLIAESNFSRWIDNMILDRLSELEAVSKSRKLSK